jgi:RNA polymerase sigma factor (sigma-70 family)
MKAYRVKVSVKNNLLLSAIEAAGFKSIAEFERSAELRNGAVQGLVAMRDCPIGQTGEFGRVAKVCMEVLGAAPTDLWTPEQLMLKLRTNIGWREVDMDIGQFQALARQQGENIAALPSPEESLLKIETARVVNDLLANRTKPNEEKVLRGMMSDEEMTLEAMGKKLGVTRERVRQIEKRALRRLRDPKNVAILEKAGLTPKTRRLHKFCD